MAASERDVRSMKRVLPSAAYGKATSATDVGAETLENNLGTSTRVLLGVSFFVALLSIIIYLLYHSMSSGGVVYLGLLLLVMSFLSTMFILGLIAWYMAGVAMRPPWYNPTGPDVPLSQERLPEYWQGITHDPKYDLGLDYEDVSFTVAQFKGCKGDRLTLRGWYVPGSAAAPGGDIAIICVHGGGRDRRTFLRHVPIFHESGFPVILFDFREHGASDGTKKGFTYGVQEHLDVSAAVAFMKRKSGCKVAVVLATSVGATASIIAAANDNNIDGVIAENPLTRPEELISYVYWQGLDYVLGKYARAFPLRWFGRLATAVFLFRIGAVREDSLWPNHRGAVDVVHRIQPRPILLLHGTADKIVPFSHSQAIFEAAREPKELWLAKDAVHCAIFDRYPAEYKKRVHAFLQMVERKATAVRSKSWSGLPAYDL